MSTQLSGMRRVSEDGREGSSASPLLQPDPEDVLGRVLADFTNEPVSVQRGTVSWEGWEPPVPFIQIPLALEISHRRRMTLTS